MADTGVMSPSTPATPTQQQGAPGVPAGLKSTFSKLFGSTWGDSNSPESGGGLIAAFRVMMPKSGSLSSSSSSDLTAMGSGFSNYDSPRSPLSQANSYNPPPPPSPGRKSTLLAVCPQVPPSMQRREWCLDDYVVTDKLYKGYASMVYKAICKRSHEVVVLKCYLMSSICELYQHQIYREVRLHSTCHHENIIKLFAAFQEGERVVMVQEYADGGDLFNLLQKYGGCLSERIAVQMVLDPFLRVLQYLHTRLIIHRDIKPENILFADKGSCLKLADFGLAIDLREERAVTRAGTLDYMAPEVLKCPYKSKPEENKEKVHLHYSNTVDSWAVGVLVYELLVGCPPFYDKSKQTTEARIVGGVPHFPATMSEAAKNFILAALRKNPEERPSVLEMVHHPWVELYRARRSMRQLNIMAAAPTAASSTFTNSQVAAAAAAAGAALSHMTPSAPAIPVGMYNSSPAVGQQQQQQQTGVLLPPITSGAAGRKQPPKHSVTQKAIVVASPLQRVAPSKEDLTLHLSAASSPCLSLTPGASTAASKSLIKAALKGSAIAAGVAAKESAAVAAPVAAPAGSAKQSAYKLPAAVNGVAAPPELIKGGSVRLDEEAMTFLFAGGKTAGLNAGNSHHSGNTNIGGSNDNDLLISAYY